MGKKLSPVEVFYLENHVNKLSPEAIAKQLGCTTRTVYNYINRLKGEARTPEGREAIKDGTPIPTESKSPPPTTVAPTTGNEVNLPPPGMSLLGRRKHGNGAAIAMTPEMSQIGDEIMKKGRVGPTPPHIHIINPNKED